MKTSIKNIIKKDMNTYFNSLRKSLWVVPAFCICVSCNDAWNDHYSTDYSVVPSQTIIDGIEALGTSQNFVKALKTTYMFRGSEQLPATYYDFLGSDQFITVWVPDENSISPEQWAEYTKPNKTKAENKKVGQEFIMNHIARFSHPVGKSTNEKIYMLSDKRYSSQSTDIDGVAYRSGDNTTNIICKNGIFHRLNGVMEYRKSIYEYLTTTPEYKDVIGDFFAKYTKEEVDLDRSVQSGINDEGEMEYIDSVIILKSILMNKYGLINEEDSNYLMVLPTATAWKEMFDSLTKRFDYGNIEAADSISMFWTQSAIMTDMFFNMNIQTAPEDSVNSTTFRKRTEEPHPRYHSYYKPYAEDGLFVKGKIGEYRASNGKILIMDSWPFADSLIYDVPIKLEAENGFADATMNLTKPVRKVYRDNATPGLGRVSGQYALQIAGDQGSYAWKIKFPIKDNLKGSYKVKLIVVPDRVGQLPNAIHPIISYKNQAILDPKDDRKRDLVLYPCGVVNGKNIDFVNKIDTIEIPGICEVPYCDYKTDKANLDIEIKCSMKSSELSKYSTTLNLDCIIFEPILER